MTPPSRQLSIWQKSIACACSSCLKMIRLAQCSPVATPTPAGLTAFRDRRVPEHVVRARRLLDPPQLELRQLVDAGDRLVDVPVADWRRSSACGRVRSLRAPARRAASSSAGTPPTFTLKCVQPFGQRLAARGAGSRRRNSPSSPPTWCRPDSRPSAAAASRSAFVCCCRSRMSSASSGVSASVM